jgi:Fe-S-cluster containining protein
MNCDKNCHKSQAILEGLLDAVETVYATARQTLSEQYQDQPVTCHKGCGACCHFPLISATSGEAFVLYHILEQAVEDTQALRNRLLAYAHRYLEYARSKGNMPFTDSEQREAFLALKIPCPLLRTEESPLAGYCSIHPARPLICDYFHSLEAPALCAEKRPHATSSAIIQTGIGAVDHLQAQEIALLGRSALGHLPLLLAAFATLEGREAYLSRGFHDDETEALPEPQRDAAYGFGLYMELLAALGYPFGERDIASLLKAQEELLQGGPASKQ